jgi:hypothetical protein
VKNSISPLTIITVGPALLAVAFPAAIYLALPNARHLSDLGWGYLIGAITGLASFGPMVAVIWIKSFFRMVRAQFVPATMVHFYHWGYGFGSLDSLHSF